MEIMIDEAIKILEHYNHGFCENSGGLSESIKVAINIMRKYQKICKILDKSDNAEQCMYDTIQEIEEVRDRNDD